MLRPCQPNCHSDAAAAGVLGLGLLGEAVKRMQLYAGSVWNGTKLSWQCHVLGVGRSLFGNVRSCKSQNARLYIDVDSALGTRIYNTMLM